MPGRRYALGALFGQVGDELIRHTPHAHHLGLRVVMIGPCEATLMLPYRPEIVGDSSRGVVFGGVITTLLDHTAGLSVACSMEVSRAVATVDLRVDYLRAAEPGLDLYARTECYKTTRNVAFVRGIAYEGEPGQPFASCLATFMLGANNTASPFTRIVREHLQSTTR